MKLFKKKLSEPLENPTPPQPATNLNKEHLDYIRLLEKEVAWWKEKALNFKKNYQ